MQIGMSCFLSVLLAANIFLFFKLHTMKKTNTITKSLRNTTLAMAGIILFEIVILLAKERKAAYFAFAFYYIFLAWYILLLFRFCVCYTGYKLTRFYKVPLFWLTVIESAALIWGISSAEFFTITHTNWYGHIYWVARSFSLFHVYEAVCAVCLLAAACVLIVAATRSAKIYRLRYTGIVMTIAAIVLCSLISGLKQQPILIQVILFAFCEMIIVYMSVYYAPRKLSHRVLRFIADKLNDGIVLYDDEHQLQLVTAGYKEAFGSVGLEGIENEQSYWTKITAEATVENAWNGHIKSVIRDDTAYYYEIQHMDLNEDGKLIGTVYWIRNVTESIENYNTMVRRANFDELTGIYNEAHFHETARQLLGEHPDKTFVMTCSRVEKFRMFREIFGKETSDEYLIRTAQALRTGLAQHPMCRYGKAGESDFYLMMPKDMFDPKDLFDKIDSVTAVYNTNNFNLEVKVGVYEITDPSLSMHAICNKTLMACDTIKGIYGRRVLWFDESIQNQSMRYERYNAELTSAIANGEIQIYLQPQIDNNGKMLGAEALARWIHKEDGFVSPAQFIPYFEMNGRITELDICIWQQACKKLKEWKEKGRDDIHISVNISAKDLYALDIYEHYSSLVKEYGISAGNLKLEITESAIINDLKQHILLVEKLQAAGFEVEMDDFGSAYSSFNMLKDICVDVLKIDMKFLGDTGNKERSHAILKSIVNLAKELNMKIIAEGVETEEQLNFLKSVGCDIYQGYYFSKPMSIADFEAKYL